MAEDERREGRGREGGSGCFYGLGAGIAGTISWLENHSIWWAILHGLLSWFYLIYRWLFG